ncbi:MAG: cytidine deaminase [Planctomycetes bacterium]|nr:cytidine deaminase [Planctomycetota bacterium]
MKESSRNSASANKDTRPSWDEYFLKITREVAQRSTCLRRQVGATLVLEKRILATGYNGAPKGMVHCTEIGCLRDKLGIPSGERQELCRGLHAEMNALLQAASLGTSIEGATLYSTNHPCVLCAKMLINCGVKRIVALSDYPDWLSKEMLQEAGVKVEIVGNDR